MNWTNCTWNHTHWAEHETFFFLRSPHQTKKMRFFSIFASFLNFSECEAWSNITNRFLNLFPYSKLLHTFFGQTKSKKLSILTTSDGTAQVSIYPFFPVIQYHSFFPHSTSWILGVPLNLFLTRIVLFFLPLKLLLF